MTTMSIGDMFDTNGWELVEMQGESRYVTRDENGVAHVGPRKRRTRGILAMMRRSHRSILQPAKTDEEATIVLPRHWEATEPITSAVRPSEGPSLHERIRHVAVDVAVVAISLSAAAIALKAAWWVVAL